MFTLFYWYFDKKGKLYYYNWLCADTVEEAMKRYLLYRFNDVRGAEQAADAMTTYISIVPSAALNGKGIAPPADTFFCLACAEKEFTPAETHALLMVRRGKSYEEIAVDCNNSIHTIRTHVYNAFGKLGVSSKAEAIYKLEERAKILAGEAAE